MPVFGGKTARFISLGLIVLSAGLVWGGGKFTPKRLSICEVQGSGEISSFVGKKVIIQGIVIADLEWAFPPGFFLVDQNCPLDEGSSQGVFIEGENTEDMVHVGDELVVTGLVREIGGETRIKSDFSKMEILSVGNDLPPGINLLEEFLFDPDTFQYEKWEGMLVTFPEGEFLYGLMDFDLPRILPQFDLDPTLQMVCLQNQSITLQLSHAEAFDGPDSLSSGDLVQNLVGILRQNTSGYLLDLIPGNDFKVIGRRASPGLVGGGTSVELQVTDTQDIYTSGTPPVITTSTPANMIIPSETIIPSLTYYPVNLLISEFFPNPTGKEPDGEWVEIYNPEPYAQSLTGIKFGDETSPTGNEGMLRFPDGYYIERQEVLVIAHQAKEFFKEFGFLPDFEMENSDARVQDLLSYPDWGKSGVQFSNSGDEVLLLDPWDGVIDMLVYGNSTAGGFSEPPPAPEEGHSLERYPPANDRDRGGDWREREGVSPGRLDNSPPTQAILPTEKPSLTSSPSPSLFPSGTASITPTKSAPTLDAASPTPTVEILPSLSPTLSITNTITSTPEVSPSSTISPLETPTPSPVITKTNETPLFPTITASCSLTWTPSTTVSLTATKTPLSGITETSTGIVTGTPTPSITPSLVPTSTVTPVHLEAPDILLNEVHADPDLILGDANNDGQVHSDDDEFLEFINSGDVNLNLSGWSISDSLKTRYVFPDGTFLKEGCGLVVFGGGDPQGNFGSSLIFRAGSLSLNNAGDVISLYDENGVERLYYQYEEEGGENQSLTRSPDIIGELPLVLHSEADGSSGDLYSPGVMLDGSVFGDCP